MGQADLGPRGWHLYYKKIHADLSSEFSLSFSFHRQMEAYLGSKVIPKISIFLWKLNWGILPTRKFLSFRMQLPSTVCACCKREEESIEHLFWKCELAAWAWNFIGNWWSNKVVLIRSGPFSVPSLLTLYKESWEVKSWSITIAATNWSIWLARNEALFSNKKMSRQALEFLIFERITNWGKVSGVLSFASDPLWKVNPLGAIALISHKISSNFWDFKFQAFDLVCAVDGAWGISTSQQFKGGI